MPEQLDYSPSFSMSYTLLSHRKLCILNVKRRLYDVESENQRNLTSFNLLKNSIFIPETRC